LPEMRARDFELEMLLGEPSSYNRDLSGKWLSNTYKAIKAELEKARNDGDEAVRQFQNHPVNDVYRYELMIKQAALQELLGESGATNQAEKWGEIPATADWLATAKQNHFCALMFDDVLFDARQKSHLCKSGVSYVELILRDASKQAFFGSAELIQRFFMPKTWGDNANPHHKFTQDKDFDKYFGGRFHRSLRSTERWLCASIVSDIQKPLASLLKNKRLALYLADMSSLDGIESAAIYPYVGNMLHALTMQITTLDTLALSERKPAKHPYFSDLIAALNNDRKHPLHPLLFPENGAITLESEYFAPEAVNDGSGMATAESIARWSDQYLLLAPEKIEIFELSQLLPDSLDDNGEASFPSVRRISGAIDGQFSGFHSALGAIHQELAKATSTLIDFQAVYAPTLALMKAASPTVFGRITYVDVTGAELKGYVIGVHGQGLKWGLSKADKKYLSQRKGGKAMGKVYEENGKLILSTNKKAALKAAKNAGEALPAKGALKVVVVPETDDIAKAYNQESTGRALKDMEKGGITLSNAYEKLRIPHFIVLVEMWNLHANMQHFRNMWDRKDSLYSFSNVFSVISDLSIAITHSANLAFGVNSNIYKLSVIKEVKLSGILGSAIKKIGGKTIYSRLAFAGIGAGFLTAGIAAYDSVALFGKNDDDAGIAMGAIAVGTAMATIGSMAATGASLSILGPVGIVIAIAGGVFYMLLKDTPIEVWINNGPFSKDPSSDYRHLQDAKIAYDRLLSLLINFDVKVYAIDSDVKLDEETKQQVKRKELSHVVRITNNLAPLMSSEKFSTQLYVRQAILEQRTDLASYSPSWGGAMKSYRYIDVDDFNSIEQELEGYSCDELRFFQFSKVVPRAKTEKGFLMASPAMYDYAPAFRVRAALDMNGTHFPGPTLEEEGSVLISSTPTFNDSDKYWLQLDTPKEVS
jgi:hypothetical protein